MSYLGVFVVVMGGCYWLGAVVKRSFHLPTAGEIADKVAERMVVGRPLHTTETRANNPALTKPSPPSAQLVEPSLPAPYVFVSTSTARWRQLANDGLQVQIIMVIKNESYDPAENVIFHYNVSWDTKDRQTGTRHVEIGPKDSKTLVITTSLDASEAESFAKGTHKLGVRLRVDYPYQHSTATLNFDGIITPENNGGPISILREATTKLPHS